MAFFSHTASASLGSDIDALFAAVDERGPGCNVGLIHDGEWLHKAGYGLASIELNVPLDGSQVHRMASVSKQFTAMAALLLADENEINLDDDIRKHLPELRDYGTKITINDMLGHTSGMGDYELVVGPSDDSGEGPRPAGALNLRSVAGGPFRLGNEDYLTIQEFYDVVKRVPLALPPKQEFRYSNLAYFLLSMLVEEVSGLTLRQYADQRIFKPLGMTHSFFSDDPVEIVPARASGYDRDPSGEYVNSMTNLFWVGDGGLHSNLDDMLLWDQQFYKPVLGADPESFITLMNTPNSQKLDDGSHYANGQYVDEKFGYTRFAHSGGWLGTSTYYARYPELKSSAIMMCNDASLDLSPLLQGVEKALIDAVAGT
ncbi:MAG: serine hydrolase domain-containing protein [Pseudomonadota bacterium]